MEETNEAVTLNTVMNYLMQFKTDVFEDIKKFKEDMNENLKKMDNKLEEIKDNMNDKIEETKVVINRHKEESVAMFQRMDNRIIQKENEMKRSSLLRTKLNNLREDLRIIEEPAGDKEYAQPSGRKQTDSQQHKQQADSAQLKNQLDGREVASDQPNFEQQGRRNWERETQHWIYFLLGKANIKSTEGSCGSCLQA